MYAAVIPIKISVSFQITDTLAPLSITAFTIIINHLAGMILLIICIGKGILEIGKIKPDKIITGSIKPNNEIIIAVCCESVTVDISIPKERAVMMNKILSNANKNKLPTIGILKTK